MPLYTYQCKDCGSFSAWAPMADSDKDQTCPSCATEAPRALATPAIGRGTSSTSAGDSRGESCMAGDGPNMGGGCCGGGMCMH